MLRHTQCLCVLGVLSTCGAGGKTRGLRGYSLGSVQEAIRWLAGAALALSVALSVVAGVVCSVFVAGVVCSVLLQELSVHSHSNVFSSGATMPARAPASIAMLHT